MTNVEQEIKPKRKAVSRIVLSILMVSLLTQVFYTQSVGSSRDGYIWHTETVDTACGRPSIDLDSNYYPHISYFGYPDYDLKHAYFDGSSWHFEIVDSSVGYDGWVETSIALDSDDNPHISYYDFSNNTKHHLKYAHYDGITWHYTTVDDNAPWGYCGSRNCIALDTNDNPHISYSGDYGTGGYDNLRYAHYDGSWHKTTVDVEGTDNCPNSIALDGSNHPHIAYAGVNSHLRYAYHDGVNWQTQVIETGGGEPSIALDGTGKPHISHRHGYYLKYTYYNGGSWQTETVDWDTGPSVGKWASIALDDNDRPRISYFTATSKHLKYAYHNGSTWRTEVVDSEDSVGLYSSLALDGGYLPHITYLDYGDNEVKYAYGEEAPPACWVAPTSFDFGSVLVGSNLEKNFTITNTGGGILTGTVSEACGHYDIVAGGGAYSLGAGDSLVVTIRFEPASCGQHDCIIETGNDLCDDVSCTGEGESPCQVSPTSLNFGTVTLGYYLDKTFTITNTGGETLTGSVSESCDHYTIVSGGGAYSLGTGDSVVVTVRFEPTSLGQHNCTIETGNDLCNDVSCTGVGGSPCQVSPTSLDFGTIMVGSYLDRSFTVTNIGDGSLTGTISESCDQYSIVSGEGAYVLASGEYLTVTVRFEPDSAGQHDCIIETGNSLCSDVYCTGVGRGEWYWKLSYDDYAPSGMPDIDQKQDEWFKMETGYWTLCGPCAVANCFKWFDSKYNVPPGFPGDGVDMFPLVRDYMDQLAPYSGLDDHDPWNVDHTGTPWNPGMGWPPTTDQPFLPGAQPQPSSMPPWGELVERLAWYFNTDGIQTGYCGHSGTNVLEMQQGIQEWLQSEMFDDGSYLADTLCVAITARPTFAYVESLVEKSENVILLLGFWYPGEAPVQQQFQEFIRGDINENGYVDAGDAIACAMGGPFNCDDAADANDDGILNVGIDIADCEYINDYLWSGGPPPPAPYPNCGLDPTPDELDCASFAICGYWWRVGGHYVTAAGVNSIEQKIAVSDPFIDAHELGLAEGRVGDGWLIEHFWGSHDPTVHNDEGNVSHDIYAVQVSHDPCALWRLVDYPVSSDPYYWTENFFEQNVPHEFLEATQPWDGVSPIYTEVEYCIHISPWDYRGDVNHSGAVEAGDVVYLIGYLYRGGPSPDPYLLGDVNCDGVVTAGDIIHLLNYLFRGWDVPRCCDP